VTPVKHETPSWTEPRASVPALTAHPGLPRGPATFLPSLLRYLVDPYGVFRALARKYGDPFLFPIPGTRGSVVTGSPEGIKAVIGAERDQFVPFVTEATYQLLGECSIFLQGGDAHTQARKIMTPPFHAHRLHEHGAIMESIALHHMAGWRAGDVVPMHDIAHRMTLDMILRVLFGIGPRDPDRLQRFHAALDDGLDSLGPAILHAKPLRRRFGGFGPWSRALRLVGDMRAALMAEIAHHRARPGEGDILDTFIAARYEDGGALSDLEIRDRLSDLIIAGHETTAVAIAWAFYELCRSPDAMGRLVSEIDARWSGPDPRRLAAVPYLEAVCLETLRLHPSLVFLSRQLARPLLLQGYEVPAGMAISMALPVVHTNERTFPEPLRFLPERFLGRSYAPSEFLPFGGGHKRCMGAAFGLHEMKVTIATVLRNFRVALRHDRPTGARPRTITVAPRRGVDLILVERRTTPTRRPISVTTAETASAPSTG
jgi:cytochrome P450